MQLKRIELVGFKSFARPTTLEFTTPITAVVGPNGSGKSNIAEAIRFVLGEQSMKSMRSKRGEDLIFNGSKSAGRLNRASVAITFDNKNRVFDLDYDEVEVKRVIFRDGTNQYFLNGNKVRLKDIVETLSSIHIGVSSHHIISQGEADRILNATVKERRTMVEDALGLRVFHYKKNESEKKLKKTHENIEKVASLRREIVPHLKFLTAQVEKIKKAEEMKHDLLERYRTYLARQEVLLTRQYEAIDRDRRALQDEVTQLQKAIDEKNAMLNHLAEGKEKSQEVLDLEVSLRTVRDEKDTISRNLGRLEGMLEYEERRIRDHEARKKDQLIRAPEQLTISRQRLGRIVEEVKGLIAEGEQTSDVMFIKDILRRVRKVLTHFYEGNAEEWQDTNDPTSLQLRRGEEDDEATNERDTIISEKTEIEGALASVKEREQTLYEQYRKAKQSQEDDRSAERVIERELFDLRANKTEKTTKLEVIAVTADRIKEDEVLFSEERTEAGVLMGLDVVQYDTGAVTLGDDLDEVRRAQEAERRAIERIKIKIEDIGGGGEEVLREYEETKERDEYLARELEDLEKSVASLTELIAELGERIDTEFKNGVEKINREFGGLFASMFEGGVAAIAVVKPPKRQKKSDLDGGHGDGEIMEEDREDTDGVDITVTLPQKRLKGLHMLSGGERALTSIALIFAITLVNPPPFIVLDETDAALDEANARKYGMMVKKLSDTTQFIIITHTRETMAQAQVLYGVTAATDGISRLLSIKFDEAKEMSG